MTFKPILVSIYLIYSIGIISANNYETIVKTSSGAVKGLTIEILNRTIDQFLGIPYAEPPLGSLRFAKPKPISKPIENKVKFYEVLNIWSAKGSNQNSTKLKPVMFWIYGGNFDHGTIFQQAFNGSVLSSHDIILVAVNYRVGILGFMYSGDESVPGNMGLYDQLLGLKWVRENIHLFGGDKNQITIFGQSAGSWSVSAHIISPLSKGLFKRAIMESGANMWNKKRPQITKAQAIGMAKRSAKQFNCTDDKQWLECLRKVDAQKLNSTASHGLIEGTEFLPFSSAKAFTELKFNKDLDLMAGVVRDEASTMISDKNKTEADFLKFVNKQNLTYHNLNATKLGDFYLKNVDKTKRSEAIGWKISDFMTDLWMKCPTYVFAKQYSERSSNHSNVFFYELTHTNKGEEYERKVGIPHSSDVVFVFSIELLNPNAFPKQDIEFSEQIVKYWTNFAKYGKPDSEWPNLITFDAKPQVTTTKILNPKSSHLYNLDLFKSTCDGIWQDYFY